MHVISSITGYSSSQHTTQQRSREEIKENKCKHARMHTHQRQTNTFSSAQTQTPARTHTHTHACKHAHTQTHLHGAGVEADGIRKLERLRIETLPRVHEEQRLARDPLMLLGPAHEALHCSRSHVQQGRQHLRQRHDGDIRGESPSRLTTADGLSTHAHTRSQSLPADVKRYLVLHTPHTCTAFRLLLFTLRALCDVPPGLCASRQGPPPGDCFPLPNQIPISGRVNFLIPPHFSSSTSLTSHTHQVARFHTPLTIHTTAAVSLHMFSLAHSFPA